ncbi:hypothetical protein D7D52_07255 [Nocardia yunnanensis]|uniref:Uncharacterized protein n=1 Tax=Nocardia yunnanensis TaxID=2382165 RepID=A0A386Z7L8_9NOCA|nr:hypothetical protein [Nocardia yunnanensis]AYF73688.1 hypothetical protein D7D52_07255 [Nocardia yunnanensis]
MKVRLPAGSAIGANQAASGTVVCPARSYAEAMYEGVCPVCGRNNQCQKASAIYAAGTSYARGYAYDEGHRRRTTTVNQTTLAKQLSPPVLQPNQGILGNGIALLFVGVIAHLFCSAIMSSTSASMSASIFAPLCVTGWPLAIGALMTIGSVVQTKQFKADLPRRQANWRVWNTVYYCYLDDVAFVPGGPPFHPGQLPGFMATNTGPFARP